MSDQNRRTALREHYEQHPPEAGVYRLVNRENGKALLGTSTNLPSIGNRLAFIQSFNSPDGLDPRLRADARQYGLAAFAFEVLDVLPITPEMTRADIAEEFATLLALWREKYDPATLY